MSDVKILLLFKKNLLDFFDDLIQQFPTDMELIVIRTFIQHQAIIDILMKKFLVSLNRNNGKVKNMIASRDEKLFLEHNMLFFCDKDTDTKGKNDEVITKENANHFKELWLSGQLDEDDKIVMWAWLDRLVQIADNYANLTKTK
jgi:hypothetical protein